MRLDVDILASLLTGSEHHYPVDEGEECVVLTHAYVEARVMLSATLALDDVAGLALAATEYFHTESFAF